MTAMGPQLTSVFRYVCSHCGHPNTYEQQHRAEVRPRLVSSRCSSCQTLNWLGALRGTLQTSEPEAAAGSATNASEAGVPVVPAAPENP
jgi:hypothetical protein